jgi:acetylornithine deacetylase/succinyl-diaminopimelate desuccinylase-like protein
MRVAALDHARSQRGRYLEELRTLLSIPSISTLPAHAGDIVRAAEWLADDLRRMGLDGVQIIPTAGNPVVYGKWSGAGADAQTALIYGHYDVQPADPLELWLSPPFEPEIRDGILYARGASDNKGQFFAHMKAAESLLAAAGRLPINVKFVLDGEEEVASPNIEHFAATHKELLAADSGIISDGAMAGLGQPSLDYGVRGVLVMEVHVRGPARDLHSGSFGGSVLNPAHALAKMIAQLHEASGLVAIPGFYERVRPVDADERARLAAAGYSETQWRKETGLELPWGEADYSLLERIAARPTCDVNGMWSGFQGQGSRTIIPATAGAKISMRLVPDQNPDEIADLFAEYMHKIAPPQVNVEISRLASCWPALMPVDSREMIAATAACKTVWGRPPVLSRGGGSLPVIAAFRRALGAPFVLMPFGLDDNRHGPNEHMILDNFYRGIETAIHYYCNLGGAM